MGHPVLLGQVMRSVLEFASVVYHTMLNIYQNNLLEGVQKQALKAIYEYDYSYEELLAKSGLPTLEQRRTEAFSKYAHKTDRCQTTSWLKR